MTQTAAEVFRDYVTDGVPGSGANAVSKREARGLFAYYETLLNAASANLAYATLALLNADLAHAANVLAIVYADASPANNGLYVKAGASGSGSWSRIADLPNGIIRLTVTGGTGDAIIATAPETPSVPGAKLYLLTPAASNTTTTSIAVNGAPAAAIKNAFGVDLAAGSLVIGSQVLMAWAVDHYQLLISAVVDGSAILATVVADMNAAAASATAAASSASALGNQVHQYDTRALAVAATIPVGVQAVKVTRYDASSPVSYATYVPGTSAGPEAFQEAGGHWWQLDLSQTPINCWWFKRSTDAGDDGLMLTRFFAAVNEQSQFGVGYGGRGVIPGGITYNLSTSVAVVTSNYRRTIISAAGAVFKTTGAIWAFTITQGGYSGGITLEDFTVYQQANATALGAFVLKGAAGVHLVRPNIIGGQTTNTNYFGIQLTLSNPTDPATSCLWCQIEKPQIYSFTTDQVPWGVFMEGDANETRVLGGMINTCLRAISIYPGPSTYYFANNVKIRDVSIEQCTYGVYCNGVLGNTNTRPEGLKVTGCRFETVTSAAIAFVNMDQTALDLPEFHENYYSGTTIPLYNPNAIGIRSTDNPVSLAGAVAFSSATSHAITFALNQPSASYVVNIDAPANQPFWVTGKGVSGFVINTTPALTGTVGWSITRLA